VGFGASCFIFSISLEILHEFTQETLPSMPSPTATAARGDQELHNFAQSIHLKK